MVNIEFGELNNIFVLMQQTEDKIQGDFVKKCHNELPQTRKLIFSVPNGGKRDQITASILNSTGLVKGIPDICFLWAGKVYWIEFKTPEGVLSKEQKEVHSKVNEAGFKVWVFRSSEEAFSFVSSICSGEYNPVMFYRFLSPYCK